MSRLIYSTRRSQQSVCVCSKSQHARVYLQSGSDHLPLSSERNTHVLCLFAIAEVFMVTTETLVLKEVRPPALQRAEMNRTHTCEWEKKRKVCCSATNPLTLHSSLFSLVFFQGCLSSLEKWPYPQTCSSLLLKEAVEILKILPTRGWPEGSRR